MSIETDRALRNDFTSFFRKGFWTLNSQRLGDEPYIDYLCYKCEEIVAQKFPRSVVNVPPRHAKTLIFSVCFAAWMLGREPNKKVMVCALDEELAEDITHKIRRIMRSSWYQRIFPTRVSGDRAKAGNFETTSGGQVFATSLHGGLAGRGGDILIIDDPSDIKDARRPKRLAQVREIFDNDVQSRFNSVGQLILVAHRIAEDDLSDHVLAQGGCNHIVLPLVAPRTQTYECGGRIWTRKKGDLLRPGLYTKRQIERLRTTNMRPDFSLFYQQGLDRKCSAMLDYHLFQPIERRMIPSLPCVISVDPGFKIGGRSKSVIQVWRTDGRYHYLVEQFAEACDFNVLRREFRRLVGFHRPSTVLIEDTNFGVALIDLQIGPGDYELKRIRPRGSKQERLAKHIPAVRRKRVFLAVDAKGLQLFIDEVAGFPDASDDCIDAFSQAMDYLESRPALKQPEIRIQAAIAFSSTGQVISPSSAPSSGQPSGADQRGTIAVALGSHYRRKW